MKSWVLFGVIVGSVCSVLSWAGNIPGRLSVFPDLISLLTPPLLVFLSLQLIAIRLGAWSRATMRRAGSVIVGTGAMSFAVGHAWMIWLRLPALGSATPFLLAFVGFVLMGCLGIWVASRWRLTQTGSDDYERQPNTPLQPTSHA